MPEKFISNFELQKLLLEATDDEKLALTKIVDKTQENSFDSDKLQEEICLFGGHGFANLYRGSGTGYLDIVYDVAKTLGIDDRESYSSGVKYYDEIMYIKNEKSDTPNSSIERKYTREEATKLGNDYAVETEQKIIIKVMENAYAQMKNGKEKIESDLNRLKSKKAEYEQKTPVRKSSLIELMSQLSALRSELSQLRDPDDDKYSELQDEIHSHEKKVTIIKKEIDNLLAILKTLPQEINDKEIELNEAIERLDNFNSHLSQTVNQYDSSSIGAITGTAGLMALANLGGFATYTFLTSMMSGLSFGTLGFGAYTAATSLLSVVIGPVGWAGLGIWTIFTLGKPDMSKLVLLVATIGAIRQRTLYQTSPSATRLLK